MLCCYTAVAGGDRCVVLATPAAAVNAGDSASTRGNGGYTVTFAKKSPGTIHPMLAYNTISQGQYQWAGKYINYYDKLAFDLYWGQSFQLAPAEDIHA
jgi:hypothetical protein